MGWKKIKTKSRLYQGEVLLTSRASIARISHLGLPFVPEAKKTRGWLIKQDQEDVAPPIQLASVGSF